jgi:hypothetical protein
LSGDLARTRRSGRLLEDISHDRALIVLGPGAGVVDQVQRRVIDDLRELGGERWGRVAILLTEDDRDRDLQEAQGAARLERILLVLGVGSAIVSRAYRSEPASIVVVTRPVVRSYTWPETLTLGESKRKPRSRSTSSRTVV